VGRAQRYPSALADCLLGERDSTELRAALIVVAEAILLVRATLVAKR
jgi:hypothetical protein